MKSYDFRNNKLFLRNNYPCAGKYQFSLIRKQNLDLSDVQLISISNTKSNDTEVNRKKGVHFFVDDYKFESAYTHPERTLAKISQYAFACTPDFSMYANMHICRQIESVSHSIWCGAFWQDQGMVVIPTINWSTPESYDFCFDAIETGSIVAIGMIGCKRSKEAFLKGYNEMLRRIDPSAIICFGSPFKEMKGNIIVVDYLSSRKVVR